MVGICEVLMIEENMVFVMVCGVWCGFWVVFDWLLCELFCDKLWLLNFGLENWLIDWIGLLLGG